jgi:uncharacterized protein (DUF2147 family)
MTIKKIAAAAATLAVIATAAVAQGASPFGTWTRPSNGAKVNFYACGADLCAKVVSSPTAGAAGKTIMTGAKKTGENAWEGDLLNTEDGKMYSGKVSLDGPKALTLKGCVLGGIICKGETWTR